MKRHHTTILYSGICGVIDAEYSRAVCSCGWKTGWDNGWYFVTRLRVWWHQREGFGPVRESHPYKGLPPMEEATDVVPLLDRARATGHKSGCCCPQCDPDDEQVGPTPGVLEDVAVTLWQAHLVASVTAGRAIAEELHAAGLLNEEAA